MKLGSRCSLFGTLGLLGTADRVDSLKVVWPDGSEQMVGVDEVDVLRVIE